MGTETKRSAQRGFILAAVVVGMLAMAAGGYLIGNADGKHWKGRAEHLSWEIGQIKQEHFWGVKELQDKITAYREGALAQKIETLDEQLDKMHRELRSCEWELKITTDRADAQKKELADLREAIRIFREQVLNN